MNIDEKLNVGDLLFCEINYNRYYLVLGNNLELCYSMGHKYFLLKSNMTIIDSSFSLIERSIKL